MGATVEEKYKELLKKDKLSEEEYGAMFLYVETLHKLKNYFQDAESDEMKQLYSKMIKYNEIYDNDNCDAFYIYLLVGALHERRDFRSEAVALYNIALENVEKRAKETYGEFATANILRDKALAYFYLGEFHRDICDNLNAFTYYSGAHILLRRALNDKNQEDVNKKIKDVQDEMHKLLENENYREGDKQILSLRYGIEDGRLHSEKEIAELMGMTVEAVKIAERRIFKDEIKAIRHRARRKKIRDFLDS